MNIVDQNLRIRLVRLVENTKGNVFTGKLPGPLPVTIGRTHLEWLRSRKYQICEKSDGERKMLYVDSETNQAYLVNRNFEFQPISSIFSESLKGGTLLDGELITNLETSKSIFMIYDAVSLQGRNVTNENLETRLNTVGNAVRFFRKWLSENETVVPPFQILGKTFYPQSSIKKLFDRISSVGDGKYIYAETRSSGEIIRNYNDGIVFTPEDEPYKPSPENPILKWKWYEKNTIDFCIQKPSENLKEIPLLIGATDASTERSPLILVKCRTTPISKEQIQIIINEMESRKISKAIVECAYDLQRGIWYILHFRWDKNTPNYITTVFNTLEVLIDNITKSELISYLSIS